jgi:hypothetical protein
LNNNRGNNRRRGRGNNNRQQGGGQPTNRIDSRARGNAPQLLEKYRKLAHDAHLNGDRVTEEYYLQFADHYFRVIADQRVRQEEARQPRQDRWQEGGDNADRYDGDGTGEYGDSEYPASPYNYGQPREREETPRYEEREERAPRQAAPAPTPAPAAEQQPAEDTASAEATPYEPAENPFTRDNRGQRGLKPRRARRDGQDGETRASDGSTPQLDLAVLPPSIAPRDDAGDEPAEAEAKPKRRAPRRKPAADDGEPVQALS